MITIKTSSKKTFDHKAHGYVVLVEEDFSFSKELKQIEKEYIPNLQLIMEQREFTGKPQQNLVLPATVQDHVVDVMFVGLGKKDKKKLDMETYRRVLGKVVKLAECYKCESISFELPAASSFGVTAEQLAQHTGTILNMASYHFADFITDKKRKERELQEVTVCVESKAKKTTEKAIQAGECIAHAVNNARHWIDLPPSDLTPPHLADKAKAIAKKHGLKITVFNEKQVNAMGMGGLAGVSRGSHLDCRLVIMEYKAKKKSAPTVAFVGKGITFDTGGLSLKPANYMEEMKDDMSGAAAVIAAMGALGELKPNINVICVTALAENMPRWTATKPGDILRFYNGKTAEVRNTDAEGRLVLGDALSYTVKHYKPDAMIDVATLTGACAYSLGPFYTGLLSQHDDIAEKVQRAAERAGEKVWRLPLDNDYKPAIRSSVADMANTGSKKYMAGTITAAFFLQNFVGDTPWVHLDIAGSAFNVPDLPYVKDGATGASVRLLVDLAMNW